MHPLLFILIFNCNKENLQGDIIMLEDIIVLIALLLSLGYLAKRLHKAFRGPFREGGCDNCSNCPVRTSMGSKSCR